MRRGQVALYLLMTLVALTVIVVMNARVYLSVITRNRVESAGDAAALAAAREQGRLLNELGRLNLAHLKAASTGDAKECERIVMEQRRLAFLGPIGALREADQAARRNGMEVEDGFADILRDHVQIIRTVYAHGVDENGEPYPEPWPGAWMEYASELEAVIAGGLAVGPDNCEFLTAFGSHMLLNANFYHAIAGRCWCWFKFNAPGLLERYDNYHYWGPLPRREGKAESDCEVFPLKVMARQCALTELFSREELAKMLYEFAEERLEPPSAIHRDYLEDPNQVWFVYDVSRWRRWIEISPYSEGEHWRFPVVGEVKPEYDVLGCAAVCRCVHGGYTWSAAAKPFGKLAGEDGDTVVTAREGLVLPCFEAVRLVPLDAVGGGGAATADLDWVRHVRYHLANYLDNGPGFGNCYYCRQLLTWENPAFRAIGAEWLRFHAGECIRPTGGSGPSPGHGGTAHGH